jgi:hypothetical protein
MKSFSSLLCRIGLLAGLLITTASVLSSRPALAAGMVQVHQDAPQGTVTIIVLDMSGSMGQNDPQGLRCSAANAFIDLSGPGNFIGVVGLDGQGQREADPPGFEQARPWTPQPLEMATVDERQQLKDIIQSKSRNCRPDNTTPTYDALSEALQMLQQASAQSKLSGSVILLTDGVPAPDTTAQISAIQGPLLSQFKDSGWPIDTVALGADGPIAGSGETFHGFLNGLSSATSGKFYDDGRGVVPGISPLNIAPFFVDIFARHNHRTVKQDIPQTTLSGSTTRRNFFVTDYTDSLDVVVVKDQPATTVSLVTPPPASATITSSGGGVLKLDDPYYTIFSIGQPQAGSWEVDVTGSGQFLMNSLKTTSIELSAPQVSQLGQNVALSSFLALGQPFRVSTGLTSGAGPITDTQFQVSGTITYAGELGQYAAAFALTQTTPGTYTGNVSLPESAPAGSYEVAILVTTVSGTDPVVRQSWTIRLERFPEPFLLLHGQPASGRVEAPVVRWDPVLQFVYALPFWPFTMLSPWALQRLPAQTEADIPGQVLLQQRPYSGAQVSATVVRDGTTAGIAATVQNEGAGRFHVQFLPPTDGGYTIIFKTSGTLKDSFGDLGTTPRSVHVTISGATFGQESRAWSLTLLYILCLLFLCFLGRFVLTPRPFGGWISNREGVMAGRGYFKRAHRGPVQWFLHRNLLYSQQAGMPPGLHLRFQRGSGIEVQPAGRGAGDWQDVAGGTLRAQFRELRELHYLSAGTDDRDEEPLTFLILPQPEKHLPGQDSDLQDVPRGRRQGRNDRRSSAQDYDDDEYSQRRRRTTRKPGQSHRRRGSSRRYEYDDDWAD